MLFLPKTRQDARELNSKAYFTGLFCKQGHIAKRWTATGNCSECQRKHTFLWSKANPEKVAEYYKSEDLIVKRKVYGKKFYALNKDYYIAKDATRRATKLQATTKWGQEKVKSFYTKAKELEMINKGTKYHVDHIIPLVSNKVCGLHNHFNLQILTASENWEKGNSWD